MKFDPQKHHRRSIRLKEYDYAQPGGYFITIVTYHRDLLLGEILNDQMRLNEFGKIAEECWRAIPAHLEYVELGAYVVMPNHAHGIVVINDGADANASARRGTMYTCACAQCRCRAPTEQFRKPIIGSIPTIIRTDKAVVTRRIGREHNATGIWQRNYGACPELAEGNT